MTNTFLPFYQNGPQGSKNVIHIIIITAVLFLLSFSHSKAQSFAAWSTQKAVYENILFHAQPFIKINPFSAYNKIVPFYPTTSFIRAHLSDLEFDLVVYPNPSSEYSSLSIPNDGYINITCSTTGKLIESHEVSSGGFGLDVSNYPEGIYIIQLFTLGESYSKRLVVNH